MSKKIRQVSEWIVIFDDLHQISSILNKKSGYQSLWREWQDSLEKINRAEQMDNYQFIDYSEMIQKNNYVTGMDN
ncbi:MAG: hypothetical protein C0597_10235 [Marinilabiliales bacterium]|nr:MAG: hypothetical protein C0597_10235 [Marinilabiliales bacterium]